MNNLQVIQNILRSAPDQQLMRYMQGSNPSVPQWAVASELNSRKEMRMEQTRQEGLGQPTVIDQLAGNAPAPQANAAGIPQGVASGMAQSMAPKTDVTQNTGIASVAPNTAPVVNMASGGVLKLADGSFPKYSEPYEEKYIFAYPEDLNKPPITLKPTDAEFSYLITAMRAIGGTITEARSNQVMKGDSAEEFSLELDYGTPFESNLDRGFTRTTELPPSVISQAQLASMVTDGGSSGLERLDAENEENLPEDMQRKMDVLALARGGAGAGAIADSLGMKMIDVIDIGMGIVGNGTLRASALVLDLDAWLNGTLAGDVISAEQFAKDATAMREFADGLFLNDGDWMPRASNMLEEVLSLPNKGDNAVAESAAYQASLDTNTANPELRTKINAMSDSMPVFAEGAPVEYTQAGLASLNAPIGRADDVGEFDKYIDARKATQKIKSDAETQERRLRLKEQSDNPPLWLQAEDEFLNPEELSIDAASVDTDSVGGAGGVNTDGTGGTGVAGSTGAGSKLGAADSYKSQLAGILDKMESSRDHDKWLSLAEMGMRLMASTNPNIVSAVGESGLGALQGYKEQQSADEKQQLNILGKLADIDLTERTLASRESIARNKPAMTTSQVMRIEREAYDDALETYTTLIRSGATGDSDQRFLLKNALEKLGKAEARVNKLYKQYNLPLVDSSISRPTIIQTGT